jgi:hypothetical protein
LAKASPAALATAPLRSRLCLLLALASAAFAADFDVKSYGAAGDGRTLDTAAIQKAIDTAGAHGGTVVFPAGRFLSGTITLGSNVTIHLSSGAVLLGSTSMADYNPKHLIYAKGVENIAIEGSGTIDGQGDAFLDKDLKPLPRPSPLIEIWDSRNIRIQDITIRRAPAWTIHPKNCDGVRIRDIELLNNLRAINSDGIDIDSSRNVTISDSHIEAGDDCIVLKTTNRGDAPIQPTENVAVTNSVLVSAASALKLGTESYADFRHIVFSNCVIRDSRTGIALLALDGGTMEDVRFQNIVMTTKPKWGQGIEWPIAIEVDKRAADSRVSHIRDVALSDITISTRGRVLVQGLPESLIENLSFRGILMRMTGPENVSRAKKMNGGSKSTLAGLPDYGPTPSDLIFAFVKGLMLDGITVSGAGHGPATLFGDRLENAWITGFHAAGALHFENSKEVHQ